MVLTQRQKQIFDYIKKFIRKKGYSPTLEDIKRHFRLSTKSGVHEHLQVLEQRGYISRFKNRARSIEILEAKKPVGLVSIPLLGNIAAGEPIEAIENKEYIAVPSDKLPSSEEVYALKVVGNSMIDEGINNGDVVLVKQQAVAENGERVVALIDNNEATLKQFYEEHGHIRLQPANKDMEPIIIKRGTPIRIQGIVVEIIKNQPNIPLRPQIQTHKLTEHYRKLPLNRIILGDALEELKKFPDKSIDVILTDPPYGLNKAGIKNDADLSVFYASLKDSYRILKDNSFYITFFSTKFLPDLFKNNPFDYFWNFILYCPNGKVGSPIGYSKYMTCTVFKKGKPKMTKRNKDIFVDTPGRMIEPDEGFIDHPTPKPKTFTSEILKMFSKEGDVVLDPFIGSGSTALACKLTKRNYIGIELDVTYYRLAEKRLKNFHQHPSLL